MNEEHVLETNQNPTIAPDPIGDDVDAVYEAFLPHLTAARRSYVRRRLGVVLLLPIVLIAGVAWASTDEAPAQVATETDLDEGPERVADVPVDEEKPVKGNDDDVELVAAEKVEPESATVWETVALGFVGSAQVALLDGQVELGELSLAPGWEGHALKLGSGEHLLIHLTNGEVKLLATVGTDLEAELNDVTPEPEPDHESRKEIAVGDVATVVVEREADRLSLVVTWSHEWWKATVVTEDGARVYATFENDGFTKHVEAWIEGDEIVHGVWLTEPEPTDDKEDDKDDKKDDKDDKSDVQTSKKIYVGDVGKVYVDREGDTLWLSVGWTHEAYQAVVVADHGTEVSAYFYKDGVEHHVRAWIKGKKIKYETWVVQPEGGSYDGSVTCGFGSVGVTVVGGVATITSVQDVEGVEWVVDKESGEVVKVRFFVEDQVWLLEAWGDGEAVVSECGRIE